LYPAFPTKPAYQGQLTDGSSPANGKYDLQFQLFLNSDQTSTDPNSLVATLEYENVQVINGIFRVPLTFTSDEINKGPWLEIGVRPGGQSGAYTKLTPRQNLSTYSANGSFGLFGSFWDGNFVCATPAIVTQPGDHGAS